MRIAAALALIFWLALPAAAQYQPGSDYRVLDRPQPVAAEDGVQVTEFFSYGCPHCFDFMPMIERWTEQAGAEVSVRRVPVTFGREQWRHLAKAFYVAELTGSVDEMHEAIFEAYHLQNRRFRNTDELVAFFAEHGHEADKVREAFNSFAVDVKVRQAEKMVRDYGVRSTPSVAVAGRYVMDPSLTGTQERMLEIASQLVRRSAGG